jgi:hypothetical protein
MDKIPKGAWARTAGPSRGMPLGLVRSGRGAFGRPGRPTDPTHGAVAWRKDAGHPARPKRMGEARKIAHNFPQGDTMERQALPAALPEGGPPLYSNS